MEIMIACLRSFTGVARQVSLYVLGAAVLAGLGLLAGCASPEQQRAQVMLAADKPIITLAAAENSNLSIRWKTHVGLAAELDEHVTGIYPSKDVLYVVTNRNHVAVINKAAGTTNWTVDFGTDGLPIFPPVEIRYNNKPALAVYTSAKLFILDRNKGTILARSTLTFVAASPGVAAGDTLCIGSEHQFFYGTYIDLLGKVSWGVREEDDSFVAAPVLTVEGNVVFCSRRGMIWKVSVDKGQAGWNHKTTGEVVAGLTADSRAVYIPCLDHKLYSFELLSSKRLWATQLDGRLDQPALVAGGNVLVVGTGAGLYAVESAKGDVRWHVPNVRQILAHSPDHVYAIDNSNNILSISLDSGTVDATTPTTLAEAFATSTDATIYVISDTGAMMALEPGPK